MSGWSLTASTRSILLMTMTAITSHCSAISRKRSIRAGFKEGSAALAMIRRWSTFETMMCCCPRLVRLITPRRGWTCSNHRVDGRLGAQPYMIAGHDGTALLDVQRLQHLPNGTFIDLPVLCQYTAFQAVRADHTPGKQTRVVIGVVSIGVSDRPFSGQSLPCR